MRNKKQTKQMSNKDLQNLVLSLNQRVTSLTQTLMGVAQNSDMRAIRNMAFLVSLEQIFEHEDFWKTVSVEDKLKEKLEQLDAVKGKSYQDLTEYFKGLEEKKRQSAEQLPESYKQWIDLVEANYLYELELFQIQMMERQRQMMEQQQGVELEEVEDLGEEQAPANDEEAACCEEECTTECMETSDEVVLQPE